MSTRGWYEFYVLEEKTSQIFLPMKFYKWGDATPHNAIIELNTLKDIIGSCNNTVFVEPLEKMLKEQLVELFSELPKAFHLGCYLFFLQRACEEYRRWNRIYYSLRSEEDREDYQFGFTLGQALIKENYKLEKHENDYVNWANMFVATGAVVRKWNSSCSRMGFLSWIQYLTQVKDEIDMGSIAGHKEAPFDISFIYRFFFVVPEFSRKQRITDIKIELCDQYGKNIIEAWKSTIEDETVDEYGKKYTQEELQDLEQLIENNKIELLPLKRALESNKMHYSLMWK